MSRRVKNWLALFVVFGWYAAGSTIVAHAESSQSPNYRLDEGTLGTNGLIESQSTNYKGSSSAGGPTVGESSSTNYQVQTGSETTNDPTLAFGINNTNVNFGSFSASTATMTTTTFAVTNYTAYGYAVYIIGDPPRNDGASYSLPAMGVTTPETSVTGTEQFGINLIANTSPTAPQNIGSNPVQTIFGVGVAATNYNENGKFRYVNGEQIASAPKSSGATTYTITYLVNVRALTPGGVYNTNQSLVVVGTY